jgi:hypothetical protein
MPGHEVLELALLSATVIAARSSSDRRKSEGSRAVHEIAADCSERRKAHVPPIRRDSDAIHPGAAGHCNPPAALTPRPKHGKRVVAHYDLRSPVALFGLGPVRILLVREVEPGQKEHREIRPRSDLCGERVDDVRTGDHADVMRVAERTAGEAEHRSVLPHESGVGL